MSRAAVEWLERDYDRDMRLSVVEWNGLKRFRALGYDRRVGGSHVIRPMFELKGERGHPYAWFEGDVIPWTG